jgi:hypothetical protein
MEKAQISLQTEISTLVSTDMESHKELGLISGLMVVISRDNLNTG